MLNNAILGNLLLIGFLFFSENSQAQTTGTDTIVVDLSNDGKKKAIQNATEVTPVLDLGAMRNQAKEDSIKIAKIQKEKEDVEKKRMEELREKRQKEKDEKEKELKALAEKRKMEKVAREKELEDKKKEKELAAALQKKKDKLAEKAKIKEEETGGEVNEESSN